LEDRIEGRMLAIEVDRIRSARDLLEQHPDALRVAMFGDTLHVTVADEDAARSVLAALADGGHSVSASRTIAPSLEDVFIEHIRREEAA
jgi:ABC-type uncharacterized transport system ATPase subunit